LADGDPLPAALGPQCVAQDNRLKSIRNLDSCVLQQDRESDGAPIRRIDLSIVIQQPFRRLPLRRNELIGVGCNLQKSLNAPPVAPMPLLKTAGKPSRPLNCN
jgi:hypothetical protein